MIMAIEYFLLGHMVATLVKGLTSTGLSALLESALKSSQTKDMNLKAEAKH